MDLLQQAFELESKNRFADAIGLYTKALEEDPNNKEVLLHLGSCLFSNGDYEKALSILVSCYMNPQQTVETRNIILQDILTAYYQPNEQSLKDNYQKNVTELSKYEHNHIPSFLRFEALSYLCIPASEDSYYLFDKKTATFSYCIKTNLNFNFGDLSPQNCYLIVNVFQTEILEQLIKQTINPSWLNGMKMPVYVVWEDRALLEAYLQIYDYQSLIASNRLVFFDEYTPDSALVRFFLDLQSILPNKLLGDESHFEVLNEIIVATDTNRKINLQNYKEEITQFYRSYTREYYRNLFNNNPEKIKILFYTSRFSVVVQYGTRDFMKACKNMGIQCELLIERSDLHRANDFVLLEKIQEFKPDIIFRIDFFKSDFMYIPENLMFVTWVQDPINQIHSKEYVEKLGMNDFILSHGPLFTAQMLETGFPEEKIFVQIVPVDHTIFHPYELTIDTIERYKSDVAVCTNYSPLYEQRIPQMIDLFSKNVTNEILKQRISDFFL